MSGILPVSLQAYLMYSKPSSVMSTLLYQIGFYAYKQQKPTG